MPTVVREVGLFLTEKPRMVHLRRGSPTVSPL